MDDTSVREMRAVREGINGGQRRVYHAYYQRSPDGGWSVKIAELPGVAAQTPSRKGIALVAHTRIALELEVPSDSFDLTTSPVRVLYGARRAAHFSHLTATGMSPDRAEAWCAAWEAEGVRQGRDRHDDDFWLHGGRWIDEHRRN